MMKTRHRLTWLAVSFSGVLLSAVAWQFLPLFNSDSRGRTSNPKAACKFCSLTFDGASEPSLAAAADMGRNPAPGQEPSCGNPDFAGAYGFKFTGMNVHGGIPYAVIGRMSSDGKQMLSGWMVESSNGNVTEVRFSGKYAVKADCTGHAELIFGAGRTTDLDFVMVNNGAEMFMMSSGEGTVETGIGRRLFASSPNNPSSKPKPAGVGVPSQSAGRSVQASVPGQLPRRATGL
jgi:hypothetical protein